ncbi:thiolase family protein [Prauserella sp. PE36]|uniref:Acetyl-CoA acetyltransferase n=3 Tax=Pseudonocardiaceae TaxID=2070 RepID=H5X745_9PSEU|nr:thiolase [Amycolatopsis albispora]EHR53513.1 acetyl-CoA acetyltransferase [Saccharomonospora marina XMU15]PXY18335.1 thiolase [Prauserella coralliicola]PXY25671.1 thiolase [Prauserella flavalba]RBM24411.1 thiolase family protein [Prauserella sp. PE36]
MRSPALSGSPAIAAVEELPPGRYPDYDGAAMQELVLRHFVTNSGIGPNAVDGLLVCPAGMAGGQGADVFNHERINDALGIRPRFCETINVGGATYTVMLTRAATAIRAGLADAVLCVGAGKFPKVGAGGADLMARMISHPDFEYPYGSFIPALYALAATRHMAERGTPREALAAVAVTSREWALRHPDALMRPAGPLTIEQVLDSRPIASPFHLLDCSVPCEGGAAFLVMRGELARELTQQPAYLLGFGEHHDHGNISHASDFATMGAGVSARTAFAMAGLAPSDVDIAQLYDAFSINPILLLEETGLAEPGKGGHFYLNGAAAPDGVLPVNTYGGLLSFGHTGDASGMSMLIEGARQVMGQAGDRQVEADIALVHTYGGMMADHSTVLLGRTAR